MGWLWNPATKQYSDESTGEKITAAALALLMLHFIDKMQGQFQDAARTLHQSGASPDQWEAALRPIVDRTQAIGYQLSRGGANAMTEADWQTVADGIANQYDYLNNFAQEAGTGQLSEDDAVNRAGMYGESGFGAGQRANAAAWDVSLPVYPPIHPGCRCGWDIVADDNNIKAYFTTADPCPICADLEAQYSPYDPATGE